MSDNITDFAILSKEERYKKLRDGCMKKLTTKEITDELSKRGDVWHEPVPVDGTYTICIRGKRVEYDKSGFGAATIFVVKE